MLNEAQVKELVEARKIASRAPKFNPQTTQWRSFKSQYKSWSKMSGISGMGLAEAPAEHREFCKLCLESSMEANAIDRIEQYRVGTAAAAACATFDQYLALVETVFQPPAQSRALQQEFKTYRQTKEDDASTYLSSKCALYDAAYAEAQRDHETLVTEVIGGLYSNVVKRRLRAAENVDDRDQLRAKLFDIVSKEREAYLAGYGESTSLDGLTAVRIPGTRKGTEPPGRDEVEPMDIDAIGPSAEKRSCFTCKKPGHLKKDCPEKDKNAAKRKKDKANCKCFHCGKKGHYIEECRKRKADKAEANKKKKGKGIQNLEEKEKTEKVDKEESSDEEVSYLANFLGETRGVVHD